MTISNTDCQIIACGWLVYVLYQKQLSIPLYKFKFMPFVLDYIWFQHVKGIFIHDTYSMQLNM